MTLFSLLLGMLAAALAAQVDPGLGGTVDAVADGKLKAVVCDTGAEECFAKIYDQVFKWLQPIFVTIATLFLVRYGVMLVNSQDEEKVNKAKQMIGGTIAALMLMFLSDKFLNAFYGGYTGGGLDLNIVGEAIKTPAASAGILVTEFTGIIGWLEAIVAVLAVTIIIVSGIVAVASYGKEEGPTQFKRTVGAVIFGVFLIAMKKVVLGVFGLQEQAVVPGAPTITPALQKIQTIVGGLLGFAGILAAAVMVYGVILMVLNLGNEEQATKAKGIIARAAIGLLAIIASFAVIQFVLGALPV